jgi:hypothetical protein
MSRLLALAVVLLLPSIAQAQGGVGGQVTDLNGRPLPGVTVIARPTDPATPRTTVTNAQGGYSFIDLPVGDYVLTFSLPGFATVSGGGVMVMVPAGRPAVVDAVMTVRVPEQTFTLPFGPPPPQPRRYRQDPSCLHGELESPSEAMRRAEALAAMRLIYATLETIMSRGSAPLPWQSLGTSPEVMALRRRPDAMGELARRIEWGADEPLPGWGIAYVAARAEIRFALIDLRDPCGFTYSSNDPDVIPRGARIVPLDSRSSRPDSEDCGFGL